MFSAAGKSAVASGYFLTNSLRFRSSASAYLNRTPASAGNRQIFTWSGWVKRGALDSASEYTLFSAGAGSPNYDSFRFTVNQLQFFQGAGLVSAVQTTQVFRDPSAWYHIILAVDTTQATASNRIKMYVNGSQITTFSSAAYPTQNTSATINNTNAHAVGALWISSAQQYLDGYMAEVNFIDGQALTPSSFGSTNSTTGVWQPAKYTGTYGTNGFYLKFSDIATTSGSNTGLGKDNSGNGNYWNTNNISVTAGTTYDAMTDVPTLTSATVANYCVANPLNKDSTVTVTDGNLAASASATNVGVTGSIAISSGKWYWEVTQTAGGVATSNIVGITDATLAAKTAGLTTNSYGYGTGTTAYKWNAGTNTAYGVNWTNGDVIGVAFDADAGTLIFYKNNSSQGTAFTGISGTFYPAFGLQNTSAYAINFGQRPFSYTPPSGYVALNTFNLPTSTIVQGNKYMDATLYTGTGSALTVTNAGSFQPDLVWIKSRSNASTNHYLTNSNAGRAYGQGSNITDAQYTSGSTVDLTAFNSNGFSLGAISQWDCNNNGYTFVGWQWQAGQGTNVTNTNGSITSTVSVNTTAGFSIVTYTATGANATVGHGLGVAPSMIIFRQRNAVRGWPVYHRSLGASTTIYLNVSNASNADSTIFNATSPTSSVFSLGASSDSNNGSMLAYCWAEIAGFSKFGSYTGNGSTDGPFIYLGFQPKYVLIKRTNAANSWVVLDEGRNLYNLTQNSLYPDLTAAEESGVMGADFLANGFKLRLTPTEINGSGSTYIYAAFASNPFKNSLAR